MEREIPGFYFDKEKGKYFRIQANHIAPPAASKYTRQAVKESKTNELKRKREDTHNRNVASQTIRRAKILDHVYIGKGGLAREIDMGGSSLRDSHVREIMGKSWAQEITDARLVLLNDSNQRRASITDFVMDSAANILYAGIDCRDHFYPIGVLGFTMRSQNSPTRRKSQNASSYYNMSAPVVISTQKTNKITSLCLTPARMLILTTAPTTDIQSSVQIAQLPDSKTQNSGWPWIIPDVTEEFNFQTKIIYCSSANPFLPSTYETRRGYEIEAVLGTSESIDVLFRHQSWQIRKVVPNLSSEVFAVEWLSPSKIVAGQRNGTVTVYSLDYDERCGVKASMCGVWRHPGSISAIKRADEWKILVAGMDNQMHLYDTRTATRQNLGSRHQPLPPKTLVQEDLPAMGTTYLSFPDYKNVHGRNLGLDIDLDVGLVAAATSDNRIQLFSLDTGQLIPSPMSTRTFDDPVTCLRFVAPPGDGGGGGGKKSLVCCRERIVEEWSW